MVQCAGGAAAAAAAAAASVGKSVTAIEAKLAASEEKNGGEHPITQKLEKKATEMRKKLAVDTALCQKQTRRVGLSKAETKRLIDDELYVDVRDRGADAIAALEYDDLIAALHVCIVDVAAMEDIMVIAISSVVADGFMRKPRSASS